MADLRESLEAAMDSVESGIAAPETPAIDDAPAPAQEDRGDGRRTDGTFAPKAAAETPAAPNSAAQGNPNPPVETAPAVAPVAAEPRKAPTAWKKEMWEHYGKLSPEVQDYIDLRERQAMEGIAPHKQAADQLRAEAESARELRAVLQPFEAELAANNMRPADWIKSIGQAQMVLTKGTPDQKLGMFQNLLKSTLGQTVQLAIQDERGAWTLAAPVNYQPQQPALTRDDIARIVREESAQAGVQTTLQAFLAEAPTKYPHYEAVQPSMIGLLQSGLAQDLPSAYEAALRLPAHAALSQQVQEQNRKAEESRVAAERAEAARKARANNLSPRSVTPTTSGGSGKKGLRATIEDAFDQSVSRV